MPKNMQLIYKRSIEKQIRLILLELLESYYPYGIDPQKIRYALYDIFNDISESHIIKNLAYLYELGLIEGCDGINPVSRDYKVNYKLTSKGVDFLHGYITFVGIPNPK
jgi:hypothetical protein